ncbi:MAG TPA: hypothetical protein EYQ00_14830, partial [Dehalococcoidia bacterium]|nr:hypothetical protein [Dehalococcoidia bacterium]
MKSDTDPHGDLVWAIFVRYLLPNRGFLEDWMMMALRMNAKKCILGCILLCGMFAMAGCNANGWMGDPTANGYYKPTPTTIPILDRIDIIEEQTVWPQLTKVVPADLTPSDLEYRANVYDLNTMRC